MPSKTKIYTRTGDRGETSIYGGKRVRKSDVQVSAYGSIDELNSAVGVLVSRIGDEPKLKEFLTSVQSDLFTIGSSLSGNGKINLEKLESGAVKMERLIDELDKNLPELKNFVLPSGLEEAAFAHLARAICRRAEREVIRLNEEKKGVDNRVIIYLNRFSDLLFISARYLNFKSKIGDTVWKAGE